MKDIEQRLKDLDLNAHFPADEPTREEIKQWIHDNRRMRETSAYQQRVKARLDGIIDDAQKALNDYLEDQQHDQTQQRTPCNP